MKKRNNVLMKVRKGLEMAAKYDVVVVGLGAMGSAAAYALAARGLRVLGPRPLSAAASPRIASRRVAHYPEKVFFAGDHPGVLSHVRMHELWNQQNSSP
jgi:sarcosine oxidase